MAATSGVAPPDLSVYYRVDAPDERLDALAARLRAQPLIECAYVKPPAEPPQVNTMVPLAVEPPAGTPDFTTRQGYLQSAPAGVDAPYAWSLPGGGGAGVRIVDVEGAWRFTHEDLLQNQGGVVGGNQSTDLVWRNHGTAVIGVFGGDRTPSGVTGICPDANVRAVSMFGTFGSAGAIRQAADLLGPGDLLLIELHRAGPRFGYQLRDDQRGYIPVEWWPDDFDAIRYATSRGVIVVEAAGNGGEDLDDPLYEIAAAGFPAGWTNPFRRANRDSGAILVGAGAPPPGTHGQDHGPDRSRLEFSNWGASLDAQGWGREVTTTGYGDLQGGSDEDAWFTDQFSGTSSASPIVTGALVCMQGVLRARATALLTPAAARALLRDTGSPQQDAPARPATQRIGNRPDLRAMVSPGSAVDTVPLHRYWNAGIGDHFYTADWNELGAGTLGWSYEGIAAHVLPQQRAGTAPLYRYWNAGIGDHFYTTNWDELQAGRYGYTFDGIACHVHPAPAAGTTPMYRYWNAGIGDHFYTTQWSELETGRWGYVYEGILCHVFGQTAAVPAPAGGPPTEGAPAPGSGSFVLRGSALAGQAAVTMGAGSLTININLDGRPKSPE